MLRKETLLRVFGVDPALLLSCCLMPSPVLSVWLEANQVKRNKRRGERNRGGSEGENCTQHGVSHPRHSATLNHLTSGHQMPPQSSWSGLNICHKTLDKNLQQCCEQSPDLLCISSFLKHQHWPSPACSKTKNKTEVPQNPTTDLCVHALVWTSYHASLKRVPQP